MAFSSVGTLRQSITAEINIFASLKSTLPASTLLIIVTRGFQASMQFEPTLAFLTDDSDTKHSAF